VGRAGRRRPQRVMAIGLAALLAMTLAAPAAFADEHEGVYPPVPELGDLVCVPEVAEPGEAVTCTASGADGIAELEVYYAVVRPPAGWEGGYPGDWDWDDEEVDWDEGGIDWSDVDVELDEEFDWDDEEFDWDEVDFAPVQEGDLTVSVAADGTAVFSFDVTSDARDGDWYEVYAYGQGPGDDCVVLDWETDEVIGRGALESEEDDSFVVDGVRYSWDDAYFYCLDDFDAFTFGRIAEYQDDGGDDHVDDGYEDDADGEEGAAPPATGTPGPPKELPRTGGATLLLTLLGLLALGGGATAVIGSRRLTRRTG
jgi:hypothetical protein